MRSSPVRPCNRDRDARRLAVLERVDDGLVDHQRHGALDAFGKRRGVGREANGNRHFPFERDPLAERFEAPLEGFVVVRPAAARAEAPEEEPELALIDRERALDGEQPVADGGRRVDGRGHRADLEADARERLQHAVVQVARHADAFLAGGDVFHLLGDEQLIERCADLTRDDFRERHDLRGRPAVIREEHAAGHALRFERRRREAGAREPRQDGRV